jgi:5'-3' exonuclease
MSKSDKNLNKTKNQNKMGIKGLFQFLKRFEKRVSPQTFLQGKSVGIDIFWYIHRSKGDLWVIKDYLNPVISYAAEVHCVFDGKPSAEKKTLLEEASKRRYELYAAAEQIEQELQNPFNHLTSFARYHLKNHVKQLRSQAWTPSADFIQIVRNWLDEKGCITYKAEEEADTLLADLEKRGVISTVFTNDSDLLVLGCKEVVRHISPQVCGVYSTSYIQKEIQFTSKMWQDFMALCQTMKMKDIVLAYSLISVYKDLDYGLQKYYINYEEDLVN